MKERNNHNEFVEIISSINKLNSASDIVNKLHAYFAKKYGVIESNIYLSNVSGTLRKTAETGTSTILDNIVNRLEEEAIIDWCFSRDELTIIPNLYDESLSPKTNVMIIPAVLNNKSTGIFLAITEFGKEHYDDDALAEISCLASHGVIRLDSYRSYLEIDAMNNRLRFLNNEMIHSSEMASIGEIVTGIANEIESPIKIIEANIQLLDSGIQNKERRLQIIKEHFERIIKINNKLKSLAESSNDNEKTVKIDLVDMMNEAILLTESQLRKNGITIEKDFGDEKVFTVGSKNQLEHVMLILLLHSKDMMQDEGKIHISLHSSTSKHVISISDNGIGFAKEQLELLFDPAFVMKVGSQKIAGLYVQKQMTNKMKGDIEVVSELGKGSTYKLILPSTLK